MDEARTILAAHLGTARTGNTEEDRLLADVAGCNPSDYSEAGFQIQERDGSSGVA
jgi:hypothetical protein